MDSNLLNHSMSSSLTSVNSGVNTFFVKWKHLDGMRSVPLNAAEDDYNSLLAKLRKKVPEFQGILHYFDGTDWMIIGDDDELQSFLEQRAVNMKLRIETKIPGNGKQNEEDHSSKDTDTESFEEANSRVNTASDGITSSPNSEPEKPIAEVVSAIRKNKSLELGNTPGVRGNVVLDADGSKNGSHIIDGLHTHFMSKSGPSSQNWDVQIKAKKSNGHVAVLTNLLRTNAPAEMNKNGNSHVPQTVENVSKMRNLFVGSSNTTRLNPSKKNAFGLGKK